MVGYFYTPTDLELLTNSLRVYVHLMPNVHACIHIYTYLACADTLYNIHTCSLFTVHK